MKIGLMVAMDKEFDLITHICQDQELGKHAIYKQYGCRYIMLKLSQKDEIILLQSGIGKVNAAVGAMLLCNMGVNCIISSGVAGSLKKAITPGMIVVGSEYRYHDVYCGSENELGQIQGEPVTFNADNILLDVSLKMGNQDMFYGLILTGDNFVDKKDVAEELYDKYPVAYAVDMESCSIAHVCHKMNMAFLSYRVISDSILNPSAISYSEFWKEAPHRMAKYTLSYVRAVTDKISFL